MSAGTLSRRLREHDWFAALIEVLIVIVGILVALEVSNWNEERRDRVRGDDYARRVHVELQSDIRNVELTREFWAKVASYQEAASAHAETGALAEGSAWKTMLAYYQASQLRPFELEDTTFVELRAGGELRLLADSDLRRGLADYYRTTGNGMIGEILRHNPVYRFQIRGLTPYAVQQYIWSRCWKQRAGADQELVDCPAPISEAEASAILQAYRSNADLLANLRFWRGQMYVSQLIVLGVDKQARELDARVQALVSR